MKKHLLLAVRIAIAALGLAYIVWAVDWVDYLKLPSGEALPNGQAFETDMKFKVVSGTFDPEQPQAGGGLEIRVDPGSAQTLSIAPSDLRAEDQGLHFVPGVLTMIARADLRLLGLALLAVLPIYPILMIRWWLLMRCRGMHVSLGKAFRLTMVGNFFNFCMPGTTGGDLIKAYYAAKGSDRRADAVMTVIVDRVAGLLGLVVLAGLAGLFMLKNDLARQVTVYIWLGMGLFTVGAGVYFSRRLRRLLRLDWLLSKLPMHGLFTKIDQAAVAYRDHRATVLLSVGVSVLVHICLATSTALSGFALGMDQPFGLLLTVVPVLFLIGAVPISPQGVGVMEFVAIELLSQAPFATANQIIGMLIMIRLNQMFYSLFGAIFLLKGDIHLHPQQHEDALAPSDESAPGVAPSFGPPQPVTDAV